MTASPSVAPTRHIILFLLILASLVHPSVGSAAVPTYTGEHFDGCGGPRGGGQRDNAGNLYLPCARTATTNTPTIRVYNAAGTLVSATASPQLPGGSAYLSDVAPSPDGSYLYVAQNDTKSYYRLVRQGNGSYAYDASFHFAQYQYGPTLKDPHGEFLTTDASGNIYISNGTWVAAWLAAPMTVLRYDASGRFLGRFGEDSSKSRKLGEFYWMITDLAVTPDGMHVYTTEVGNNRVQRWDRQFDGSFVATTIYGNTAADDGIDNPATAGDESRQTNCATGHFGAPYASALDTAGNLYVVNTNCWAGGTTQVQRLDRATGTWATITGPKYGDDQAHEIAIDGAGSIYVASVNTLLRAGSAPIAVTDVTAPVFNGAALPAATDTRTVTLALSATDNFGVTQVRVATDNADITSGTWQNFGAQLAVELSAGDGPKTVRVQVRDAAGNLSAVLVATTIYTAPAVAQPGAPVPAVAAPAVGENAAPVLKSVALPNPATTQTVTVTTVAIDDAKVTGMRLATEEGTWSDWRDYAATTPFALTAGTGFRGVSVQVRDAQGLVSNPVYTITTAAAPGIGVAADVTAPTLTASLNALTETRTTTLRLIATDAVAVTQVRTAVEGVDIESAAWRDYAPTQTVLLPEGNGIKWVSVQVRDAAGNVATAAAKIELVVPVAAPAGGVAVNTAPVLGSLTLPATSPTSTITVQLGASDDRLVTKMRFATEDGNWRAWQDFTATSVFVLTPGAGPRGVFAQVQDADGLVSTVLYR
ncbi:MAG: phage tail protein, partial [Thermoleophilia bacterium]|nr:phage tail protein [Thermoleophilia bacterium]